MGASIMTQKKLAKDTYKKQGIILAEYQLSQMTKQLDNLKQCAHKHK